MISVIIPVYNAEQYIPRCLDSLLAQSYAHWEGILIDDGSSDGSLAVCESYVRKDARFHVIHQENQGVSAARNAGVAMATGDYIAFIDADDYILPDYLERLLHDAETHNADIACCDFTEIITQGLTAPNTPRVLRQRLIEDQKELFADIIEAKEGYCACVWAKLIRTTLAKKVRFQTMRFGEDHVYMFDLFSLAPTVSLSTYKGYCYAPNAGSATVKHSAVSIPRRADELRMHKYKLTHLPDKAKDFFNLYYHNYALAVIGLIGAVCGNGYPPAELRLALAETREILKSGIPLPFGTRLRFQLFQAAPRVYGSIIRLKNR